MQGQFPVLTYHRQLDFYPEPPGSQSGAPDTAICGVAVISVLYAGTVVLRYGFA